MKNGRKQLKPSRSIIKGKSRKYHVTVRTHITNKFARRTFLTVILNWDISVCF